MQTQVFLKYVAAVVLVLNVVSIADEAISPAYKVTNTLKIGGEGGWDYATLDDSGKLLFMPRSTHVMVVDTEGGKVVADFGKIGKGHGVALAPEAGRGFVTDGQKGTVTIFDLKNYAVLGTIAAADDADGIIYDRATHCVLVSCGDAGSLVSIPADVNPTSGKAGPAVDLGGKPEFIAADGAGNAYVNIADKDMVAKVDTKTMKLLAKWPTTPGKDPTGLSLDAKAGRLYVGCRNQKMIVMSTKDGSILADLPIGHGVDATAFRDGTAFASCGDGTLTVIRETSPAKFEVVQTVKTAAGARTMAVDRATGKIFLPTAEMDPSRKGANGRPSPIAGTFQVIVVDTVK